MSEKPVLIDTSTWVDSFRGKTPSVKSTVRMLLENDQAVTCGPVLMELYRGLKAEERKKIIPLLSAIRRISFEEADWEAAGELDRSLRQCGITLPPVDIIIAQLCIRTGTTIFTLDDHFKKISGIQLFEI